MMLKRIRSERTRERRVGRLSGMVASFVALCTALPVFAADTIEPFGPGLSDLEAYVHILENPGGGETGRAVLAETISGYGFTPRLSGAFGVSWEGVPGQSSSTTALAGTLFGTLVDTPHVDLDAYLGAGAPLDGSRTIEAVPGLEINLDFGPDQAVAGAYLRVEWPLGVPVSSGDARTARPGRIPAEVTCLVGAYVTLGEGHQLLVELPAGVSLEHGILRADAIPGEIVVGYNARVAGAVELITQVAVEWASVETQGLAASSGVMLGVIVTR